MLFYEEPLLSTDLNPLTSLSFLLLFRASLAEAALSSFWSSSCYAYSFMSSSYKAFSISLLSRSASSLLLKFSSIKSR